MMSTFLSFFWFLRDEIKGMLDRLPNKKQTLQKLIISITIAIVIFLCLWLLVTKKPFGIPAQADMTTITITSVEVFSCCFFILSFYYAHSARYHVWRATYGIGALKTIFIALLSLGHYDYIIKVFSLNLRDFSHNLVFTAMMLVQVITVIYAGFDLLNFNNLHWFLRTWPYSATGIFFIQVAFHQLEDRNHSLLLENNSVANTILSFITITYFVQVFNERFCKKQDDQPKAQSRNRLTGTRKKSIMTTTNDEIKTAMKRLHSENKKSRYVLVNPSFLRFSCPIREPVNHGISYRFNVTKFEGILLYDSKTKLYLGYFSLGPKHHRETLLLPCTNGEQYDKTGEERLAPPPVDAAYGTCNIDGSPKKP